VSLHDKRIEEPPDEDADDEAVPASRRRLAGVLSLVAATLVWTAAASAYLRTGQVKVALVAVGLVCAVLPLVMRSSESPGPPPHEDAPRPGDEG